MRRSWWARRGPALAVLPAALLLLAVSCARPAAPVAAADVSVQSQFDLQRRLGLASDIRTGTLDNGVTWFVRPHGSPPGRVQLRLAVDAGSVLERDDQLGYAHIVEHMAFNGTEAYPGTSLVGWLEAQGIPFGVHINAHTGLDETVYELQVPTDDPAVVDQAIGVLSQWASAVTFDPVEVDRERGVLIEEWRAGQGFQARATEALFDAVFADSIYGQRPPIGTEASLRSFDAQGVRGFYETWYRPSLLGVVVVGDVDADHVEQVIAEAFGGLVEPADAVERARPVLTDHALPRVSVLADPEAPQTSVSLIGRLEDREEDTLAAYRDWIVGLTVQIVAEDRLRMLNRDTGGAVVRTDLGFGRVTPAYSAWSATAVAPDAQSSLRALEALCGEIHRLRTHGIQEPELERARRKMKTFQRQIAARAAGGETPSGELADELVRHFLTDEPAPDFEEMARITQLMMDEITPAEASAWVDRNLFPGPNRSLQVVVQGEQGPSSQDVLAAYTRGFTGKPTKLQDTNIDRPLVLDVPEPGSIVSTQAIAGTQAVRWRLSNGATVVFEPRTTQPDRVVMLGDSPGGLGQTDAVAGLVAVPVSRLSGLGEHSPLVLAKLLAGRDVEVDVNLSGFHESIDASGGTHELEALFQLTWMRLSRSRFELQALERTKRFLKQALDGQRSVPENAAQQRMASLYWSEHPAFTLPTDEQLDAVTLADARATLSDRLGSAHDWTFVIVGDVTVEQVQPLVERWLASLPGEPGTPEAIASDLTHPDGVVVERMVRGATQRALVNIRLHHPLVDFQADREASLQAMSGVLSVRLRDALREDLGGTYVPMVSGGVEQDPRPAWVQSIVFQCDPERVDELRAAVSRELERLREQGPTAEEVQTQRRLMVREWEVEQRSVRNWAGRLLAAERTGVPAAALFDVGSRAEGVTVQSVQAQAQAVLLEDRRVEVILVPESGGSDEIGSPVE